MAVDTRECVKAKLALRQILAACGGNTKDETVIAAIENLRLVNPNPAPTRKGKLLDSNWVLISAPNFPGGKRLGNGKFVYTLGRLAFNMFQPTTLKLVIDRVSQPIFLLGNGEQRSHDIVVEFTTVDENYPQISGVVRNLSVCEPISDTALQVKFTGGILAPKDPNKMDEWRTIFGQQSQNVKRSLKDSLMFGLFKLMFGLVPPQGINSETGEAKFIMERSPKGRLEILYLDEELRITCGEKEMILVCERQ
ncbi:fimbrial protein [Nostoc sp. FACHB-87]|uniref:PAP/fibrillin family protein n=1 Tax=Nostocaceae TaxID=1162 RepID=UPI001687C46D|nr:MULTISPECIES: PAP/fibrillin family protein [Nostocaceae]MBD2457620.1 fimbrial protein [Nostoc sp. FACHB-87]MBD2477485.1 fimbrial protein [Anabaena sp. FACHB-83]